MSKDKDPKASSQTSVPSTEVDKPLPQGKLPKDLQKLVDDEDSLLDQIYDGNAKATTDTNLRYAAYASRLRTILLSAHRYVAYTSDIGESFRPIAHPWLIKGAYGISWAYLIGDVGHEGYKAYLRNQQVILPSVPGTTSIRAVNARETTKHGPNVRPESGHVPAIEDYRSVMLQRAIFQGVASMGLPAFTIHSIVRYSGRALQNSRNTRIRTYGPIGLGLAVVPFLPFIFDKPIEHVVDWGFHKAFETLGGPDAVGHPAEVGHESDRQRSSQKGAKEKEL